MPRNGSGQYNPLTNTWNPPVTGVLATGADFQAQLNDISAAITQSLSKDGQTPMSASLPLGNNSIVGIAAGTAAAPSISPNGDTNTGVYFPSADTVAIATAGVKRVEVDANGNVGVGVTPSAWGSSYKAIDIAPQSAVFGASGALYFSNNAYFNSSSQGIYKTTAAAQYMGVGPSGGFMWNLAPSGTAGNPITFTQAMTLDASGNLSCIRAFSSGNSTFAGSLNALGGGSGATISITPDTISGSNGVVYNTSFVTGGVGPHIFQTGGTERARITSDGNLLVGTSSASSSTAGFKVLNISGSAYTFSNNASTTNSDVTFGAYSTGAGSFRFYVGMGGTVYATNTTITAISDQRLKENIQDIDVGLDKIMALKPRKFDWKEGKGKNKKGDRGWIAQEFEQVFPDMIDEWRDHAPDGEEPYKAVNADLIPVLVKSIQEQQAIIQQLTARITALEAK